MVGVEVLNCNLNLPGNIMWRLRKFQFDGNQTRSVNFDKNFYAIINIQKKNI